MGHPEHAVLSPPRRPPAARGGRRRRRRGGAARRPGHFGKTTLAAGFDVAGYRVLCEDVSCIRLSSAPSVVRGLRCSGFARTSPSSSSCPGHKRSPRAETASTLARPRSTRRLGSVPLRAVVLLRSAEGGDRARPGAGDGCTARPLAAQLPAPDGRGQGPLLRGHHPARSERPSLEPRPPPADRRARQRGREDRRRCVTRPSHPAREGTPGGADLDSLPPGHGRPPAAAASRPRRRPGARERELVGERLQAGDAEQRDPPKPSAREPPGRDVSSTRSSSSACSASRASRPSS